jgi:hypothetical protein
MSYTLNDQEMVRLRLPKTLLEKIAAQYTGLRLQEAIILHLTLSQNSVPVLASPEEEKKI